MPEPAAPPADLALTPEQARAEMDATRAADSSHPWKDPGHRNHQAAHERFLALAQRAASRPEVPAPAPPPSTFQQRVVAAYEPAPLRPEQARAEIERRRADPNDLLNRPNDPRHAEAQRELEALYRLTTPGEDGRPPEDPEAETNTVVAAELPAGYEWDEPTLNALGEVADREQISPDLLREGTAIAARLLTERVPGRSSEDAEAQLGPAWDRLEAGWGRNNFDVKMAAVAEVWALLPPKVQQDLRQQGLWTHPEFLQYLARVHEHMHDGRTDAGLARLKTKWTAKAAAKA